jgi:hypothetical protein
MNVSFSLRVFLLLAFIRFIDASAIPARECYRLSYPYQVLTNIPRKYYTPPRPLFLHELSGVSAAVGRYGPSHPFNNF